jgi:CRP/FNR family cyclic AMP-dependent transcriptional regulator
MSNADRNILKLLSATPFLRELCPGDQEKVAAIAASRQVPASTVLYQEGDVCERLYLVSSGLVALDMCMPRQGCTRILTIGPGEIIGWSALFADATMAVRASALQDSTLIALPAAELRQLCDDDHDIGYAIMQKVSVALSRRLLATRLQMLDMFGETQPVTAPASPSAATIS